MIESCTGCLYDLGGGRDNCCLGVAAECRDGGGYEAWTDETHRNLREAEFPAAPDWHPKDASGMVAAAAGSAATAIHKYEEASK